MVNLEGVEKRFGVGYTLNFGHFGAWLILAGLLGLSFLGLLFAVTRR